MVDSKQLVRDVLEWSFANFGKDQQSKLTGEHMGFMAPVLGFLEEFGELIEAVSSRDRDKAKDSVGDMGIYFCDVVGRVGYCTGLSDLIISSVFGQPGDDLGISWDKADQLSALVFESIGVFSGFFDYGRFFWRRLLQDYSETPDGDEGSTVAFYLFAQYLPTVYQLTDSLSKAIVGEPLLEVSREVFESVVSKRQWRG